MDTQQTKDQYHPREHRDRLIVDQLLACQSHPRDVDLAELARLRVRYQGFPGARTLQEDLSKVLNQWNLSEEELFDRTRAIHAQGTVYQRGQNQEEDWS